MNAPYTWAASLAVTAGAALGELRGFGGVEVCVAGECIWLRGVIQEEGLEQELRRIPALRRYEAGGHGRWKEVHSRIPSVALPSGPWQPLRDQITLRMPPAAVPAQSVRRVPLTLRRGGVMQEPDGLLVSAKDWVEYAVTAPALRLARLCFAAEESGKVLIVGKPLPAIPGERLVNCEGIMVPCGWQWSPAVSPAVLQQLFALEPGSVVRLTVEGTQQVIKAEQFVPATRAAARTTYAGYSHA